MNLKSSITRVSEPIRKLILTESTIKARYEQGQSLASILSCRDWAFAWIQQADEALLEVIRRVLNEFAGTPFELDTLMRTEAIQQQLNGAEIRIAVARLRRNGILFGIRKAWGDQLIYLPVDTVAMWQSLLLPFEGKSLTKEETSIGVTLSACNLRLPLSLEVLNAWQSIYRHPLLFSSKGVLTRSAINRVASEMFITPSELASLKLAYPQHESVPTQVAFAIDLGLCNHVLQQAGNELNVQADGLKKWLRFSPIEANMQLFELIMNRYGSVDPSLHLIAAATSSLPVNEWFTERALREFREQDEKVDQWLGLLESFGWLERGMLGDLAVFRKNGQLEASHSTELSDRDKFLIQPDGEIIVPPETGLATRWMLEEIAERVATDHLFVYRLTRRRCENAFNIGHSLEAVILFLEHKGADSLPVPCRRALQDWFAPLGKVKFAEVMLLRTESPEIASALSEDIVMGKLLLERVGERDFIVEVSSRKALQARLSLLGYPLWDPNNQAKVESKSTEVTSAVIDDCDFSHHDEQTGWIYSRHTLAMYDPDATIPSKQELFPGITTIPVSWIMQPRLYHPSTSKDMIQRAMDWQVAIQTGKSGDYCTFTPAKLEEEGASWCVIGSVMQDGEQIVIQGDEMKEIMIVLPPLRELESI